MVGREAGVSRFTVLRVPAMTVGVAGLDEEIAARQDNFHRTAVRVFFSVFPAKKRHFLLRLAH